MPDDAKSGFTVDEPKVMHAGDSQSDLYKGRRFDDNYTPGRQRDGRDFGFTGLKSLARSSRPGAWHRIRPSFQWASATIGTKPSPVVPP